MAERTARTSISLWHPWVRGGASFHSSIRVEPHAMLQIWRILDFPWQARFAAVLVLMCVAGCACGGGGRAPIGPATPSDRLQ